MASFIPRLAGGNFFIYIVAGRVERALHREMWMRAFWLENEVLGSAPWHRKGVNVRERNTSKIILHKAALSLSHKTDFIPLIFAPPPSKTWTIPAALKSQASSWPTRHPASHTVFAANSGNSAPNKTPHNRVRRNRAFRSLRAIRINDVVQSRWLVVIGTTLPSIEGLHGHSLGILRRLAWVCRTLRNFFQCWAGHQKISNDTAIDRSRGALPELQPSGMMCQFQRVGAYQQ